MDYTTINLSQQANVGFLQLDRPQANNAINHRLITECTHAVRSHSQITIWVIEGLEQVFCSGADFNEISSSQNYQSLASSVAKDLYDLWLLLATGDFISIAAVKGKATAGGLGFVCACDMVLADETASFTLSELLFGLYPACVLPFMVRKVGFQKANYMTLSTRAIQADQALSWGLVDAMDQNLKELVRRHLLRIRKLSKQSIAGYKAYINQLQPVLTESRLSALQCHDELFSDSDILNGIVDFVSNGALATSRG